MDCRFAAQRQMQPDFMYAAVASGEVDVIAGYTSDGLIAKYDLVVLDDPKHAIPPYDAIMLLAPKRADDQALRRALQPLLGRIEISRNARGQPARRRRRRLVITRYGGALALGEDRETIGARPPDQKSDRLAIDVLGREHAIPERIALDAALLPLFATGSHGLADAERHKGCVGSMMVSHLVETLHRKPRLLLCQMLKNGGRTGERLRCHKPVVEAPEKVGRDHPVERIHVVLEQGSREALEQFVTLGRRRNHDLPDVPIRLCVNLTYSPCTRPASIRSLLNRRASAPSLQA